MAFSASIMRDEKQLADCPYIASSISKPLTNKIVTHKSLSQKREEAVERLKIKLSLIDLISSGQRLGANMVGDKLAIKCLGKDFFIDPMGKDLVNAVVLSGKKAGTHMGKVVVRTSGYFNVSAAAGVVQGINHRHCSMFYRAEGYSY